MKPKIVVTFGRSSKNNVVLNDSGASRVQCQIIQYDDDSFAITVFNSTNGAYVNGVRINGQVSLAWDDSVQIANTSISWQQCFVTEMTRYTPPWVWPMLTASAVLGIITA